MGQNSAVRWKRRPQGSNWGDFGADDQLGRLNLITPEKTLEGIREVREGIVFSLSLSLNLPGGNTLNPNRHPPRLHPTGPIEDPVFLRQIDKENDTSDIVCDDMVTLCLQYSTQWDALCHVGYPFDANDDGEAEIVFYNGFSASDNFTKPDSSGDWQSSAKYLGIENMAQHGVQGRAVLIDLHRHFGESRVLVGYDKLMYAMEDDGIEVERGDMVCLHTGFAEMIVSMKGKPDGDLLARSCPALNGYDSKLLNWIETSGLSALIADNYAVEHRPSTYDGCSALIPLHEHCLFKLGIPLGELWYLTPLARWLRRRGRNRFLLTAPPLYLEGAVGSPLNPVATV